MQIVSIEKLEDCTLKAVCASGDVVFLFPQIFANSYASTEKMKLYDDKNDTDIVIDTSIATIDNVPFVGTFTDLETAIRTLVKDANCCCADGGVPVGAATEANQDNQITELQAANASLDVIEAAHVNNAPSHQELTNPVSVVFSAFKELTFVADGAIDVTIDGNTIQYPYSFGGGTRILGSTFKADADSVNSVTFNGTGTVLVTYQN